jgi:hypothetical protein
MSDKPANTGPDDSTNRGESTSGKETEGQDTSNHDWTPTFRILLPSIHASATFLEYVKDRQETNRENTKRLNREAGEIDKGLRTGSISKEQAEERLAQIKQRISEVSKEALELMQFAAQVNRDIEPVRMQLSEYLVERGKLEYDFHKHFTTLGTASRLFIVSYYKRGTIYVRRIKSRKRDYFQLVRSYRNEEGKPRQEVLVHLGEYPTPEDALRAWPEQIAQHRRAGRDDQAEKLQDKLDRLQELTEGG